MKVKAPRILVPTKRIVLLDGSVTPGTLFQSRSQSHAGLEICPNACLTECSRCDCPELYVCIYVCTYFGKNEDQPPTWRPVSSTGDLSRWIRAKGCANFSVNFIPWIQTSSEGRYYFDGIRLPDGQVPTVGQTKVNASLLRTLSTNPALAAASSAILDITDRPAVLAAAAKNIYQAHKDFLDHGLDGLRGDDYSELAYLHNVLGDNLNITDQALGGLDRSGDGFWSRLYDDSLYFSAYQWATIDGGLSRLPASFHPSVDAITRMNVPVSHLEYHPTTDSVTVSWRDNTSSTPHVLQNASYDYAIVAAPFTAVRSWRFPNTYFDPSLTNAISNMPYIPACKVALHFHARFWEHLSPPIFGSCSTTTDIPRIGSICYPSYALNSSGPGVLLGSYIYSAYWGTMFSSWSDEKHAAYVLDAIAEIHGEQLVRGQYTGQYVRRCWSQDPLTSASWASPSAGMHRLYIPHFFRTENKVVFVGEHTSYTHAWIASALESGIRGAVQVLLDEGLVDEAKAVTREWMGRWISV